MTFPKGSGVPTEFPNWWGRMMGVPFRKSPERTKPDAMLYSVKFRSLRFTSSEESCYLLTTGVIPVVELICCASIVSSVKQFQHCTGAEIAAAAIEREID